ncbi:MULTISPECIES: helix-turn-helix domain-containing protein [Metallosphaera]|uniref:Transcriptional regulator, TrmB n=3 Tax=Metallosphaera TaxID=41980 RepID=A4YH16_METS5|nr:MULTISPECIES: helix-turn-helix domain-containing protein [Metallosphaera]ABP95718.1 transcriptional regulator, TrmB [Metallosphaera sedula DSM 5348]AIM27702.1 transcriptional regulator, TrmB [Metallosphaera sedula]AKV74558.1 TrmB family transcriptional regulator [Metallosphaera sedula]AKV76797.1 TrmB family transcriptional regulator [Metallosphaera sedula]AKV79048.1 TrmB family transcriptional regulator [Metallosphaera sedula]
MMEAFDTFKDTLKERKESIRCCYKISDTDVECLFKLIELGEPKTSVELGKIMGLSKTTVENSMKKLIELGLVERIKVDGKKIGRPKFLYVISDSFQERVKADLKRCAEKILSATS